MTASDPAPATSGQRETCECGHYFDLHDRDDTACLVWRQTEQGRLYCPCPSWRRETAVLLTERTRFGGETGAGILRNRCSFTPRDMGADWPEAFTYAVVFGWDDAMDEMAARWDWDEPLVEFLRDAHERFASLPDRTTGGDR